MTKISASIRTLDHWPREQLYGEIGRLLDRAIELGKQKHALRNALENIIADPIGQAAMDYQEAREALQGSAQ